MARDFLQFPFAPYNGALSSAPFQYTGRKGISVRCDVKWNTYSVGAVTVGTANPNFNVTVNLDARGPNSVPQGWLPQSVYIDNMGVDFPVYVFFPDTHFPVSCPPNSSGWFEVFTNSRQAFIVALGILDTTRNENTAVFFTDVQLTPYVDPELNTSLDLWLGSPNIQRSNLTTTGVGSPALGDQVFITQVQMNGSGGINIPLGLLGPQPSPLNLYITQIQACVSGFTNNGAASLFGMTLFNDSGSPTNIAVILIGGNNNVLNSHSEIILDLKGNFKYSGQLTWHLSIDVNTNCTGGVILWSFAYSFNNR